MPRCPLELLLTGYVQVERALLRSSLVGARVSLRLLVGGTLSHHRGQVLRLRLGMRLGVGQTRKVHLPHLATFQDDPELSHPAELLLRQLQMLDFVFARVRGWLQRDPVSLAGKSRGLVSKSQRVTAVLVVRRPSVERLAGLDRRDECRLVLVGVAAALVAWPAR